MSAKDDGGPAFIWGGDLNECPTFFKGMALRDYFAAAALQGMLADPNVNARGNPSLKYWAGDIAEHSYIIAAAMLKEREK